MEITNDKCIECVMYRDLNEHKPKVIGYDYCIKHLPKCMSTGCNVILLKNTKVCLCNEHLYKKCIVPS